MRESKELTKFVKGKSGITLIALVITIIVLLILAGVSIMMLTGDNSILNQATNAKKSTIEGQEKEAITIAYNGVILNTTGSGVTAEDLDTELKKNGNNADAISTKYGIQVTFNDTKHVYILGEDGELETKSNVYDDDDIISVRKNYILRANGKLSSFNNPERSKDMIEATAEHLNEIFICDNVKKLFSSFVFLTNDNKLYYKDKDNLISDDLSKVIYVDNNGVYYLGNNKTLHYYDLYENSDNVIIENIEYAIIKNSRLLYINTNDKLYYKYDSNSDAYDLSNTNKVMTDLDKLVFYVDKGGSLKSWSNDQWAIENVKFIDTGSSHYGFIGNAWFWSNNKGNLVVNRNNELYVVFSDDSKEPIKVKNNLENSIIVSSTSNWFYNNGSTAWYILDTEGTPYKLTVGSSYDITIEDMSSLFDNKKIIKIARNSYDKMGYAEAEDGTRYIIDDGGYYTADESGTHFVVPNASPTTEKREVTINAPSYDSETALSYEYLCNYIKDNNKVYYDISTGKSLVIDSLETSTGSYDIYFSKQEGKWYYRTKERGGAV